MKTLLRVCLTVILTCAFMLPARAGEIECGIANAPPCHQQPVAPPEEEEPTDEPDDPFVGVIEALLNGLLLVL